MKKIIMQVISFTNKVFHLYLLLFTIDDEPQEFYIIKRGGILIETIIEIDEFNRYPVVIKILVNIIFRGQILGK